MAMPKIGGRRMHFMLTDLQISRLQKAARRTGLPVATHVRLAMQMYLRAFDKAQSKE